MGTAADTSRGDRAVLLTAGWRLAVLLAGLALIMTGAALTAGDAGATRPRAKNVIVMISDGMGYNTMIAGDYFQHGAQGAQVYERFRARGAMSTYSYYGSYDPLQAWGLFDYLKTAPTDSAAAATAMATGVKTYDAAIGVDIDGRPLRNVAQRAEALRKSTGVVTSVEWSHATPAGFVAHNVSRSDYAAIAREMVDESGTDVIMGAGSPLYDDAGAPVAAPSQYQYVGGVETWNALVAGTAGGDADGDGDADVWKLIQSKAQFERLTRLRRTPPRVCGTARVATTLQQNRDGDRIAAPNTVPQNTGVPQLATMTRGALNVLDANRKGFFLMVESGAVDWAGHANQPGRLIEEQIAFNKAVAAVVGWVGLHGGWDETLLIVTADHETGYVWGPGTGADASGNGVWVPLVNNGKGALPGLEFNATGHTNSLVPFFARGAGAARLRAAATQWDPRRGRYLDNTAIAKTVFSVMR